MGWNNSIFPLLIITPSGGFTGLFLYSPGPGAGNLIDSITAAPGTDPYGNQFLGNITAYGSPAGGAANLGSNALAFYTGPDGGPFTKQLSEFYTGGSLQFNAAVAGGLTSVIWQSLTGAAVVWMFPSGDTTGVFDTAQLVGFINLATVGAYIFMAPGTYYVKAGQVSSDQHTTGPIYLYGSGRWATIVNGIGTGDVFRLFSSVNYSGAGGGPAGGCIEDLMVDVSAMGAGSSGIHVGDIYNFSVDGSGVRAGSSPAAGIINYWFDNQFAANGCEQLHGRIWTENASGAAVQFDLNPQGGHTPSGSFDRAHLDIYWDGKGHGDGLVFNNGAFIVDGDIGLRGNTDYGSSLHYVMKIQGSNGAGSFSRIANSRLDIGVECNATVGTQPGTILFNTAGSNTILGCNGLVDFAGNNLFAGAGNNALKSFQFDGPVYGDNFLQRCLALGNVPFAHGALSNGQTIQTKYLLTNKVTTTTDVTGIILEGFQPDDNRLFLVENKGTGHITFDVAGTSNVADGASDVIPPNASALYQWDNNDSLWYRVQASRPDVTTFNTSDQLVNSTTFAAVCNSGLAVGVGTYRIRAVLQVTQGPNANPNDFRLGFTGTISQVRMGCTFVGFGGVANNVFAVNTTSNNGLLPSPGFAIGATYRAEFDGIIVTTSTGTLSLQAAMDAPGDTFTVLALSFFRTELET